MSTFKAGVIGVIVLVVFTYLFYPLIWLLNAVVSFYGEEAGAELTRLLKNQVLIAVDLIAHLAASSCGEVQARG